jgi:hypothetical protein
MDENRRVDFIGIGVQKAATTWLYECLGEHPQIGTAGPARKELNFFNHHYEYGYAWYQAQFEFRYPRVGEFSVRYFADQNVPARVHRYSPEVRLILSLRNPIDRAFSQHLHEVGRNRLSQKLFDFWAALEQNPTYVDQGRYATHLERWLQYFRFGQIHVILFDDVCQCPDRVVAGIFDFLEVDPSFHPTLTSNRRNVAHAYRSLRFRHVVQRAGDATRGILGDWAFEVAQRTRIPRLLHNLNDVPISRNVVPPLSSSDRARLGAEFASDLDRLSELIGRDLSSWRR